MKHQRYVIRDTQGIAKVLVRTTDDEPPEVEPWMAENIRSRGWTIEKFDDPTENAIDVHGYADWKAVAETLATALRPLLSDEHEVDNEKQAEEFLDNAQQALDAFDVAQMEANLAITISEPEQPEQEEGSDDG